MSMIEELAAAFVRELADVRRLSTHTIDAYRRDLNILTSALPMPPAHISPREIRRLLAAQRGMSAASTSRRLCIWRLFFNHMQKNGKLLSNPTNGLRAPKKSPRLPKALTPDKTTFLLDGDTGDGWLKKRDDAMFELMYSAGVRVSELVAMDVNDMLGGMAQVRQGKGGRGRTVPVGAVAMSALHNWLKVRTRIAKHDEVALFVSYRGQRLSVRTVQQRLSARAARLGMAGQVSPHVLRHSCASHFLQSSGNLRATQDFLGHRDIASTQIYVRLDFQNLARTYDRAHPRADKKIS